eukprot:GHVL01031328.1.p1 GENE.GHVL01031328.1~~GHVL01031328.1.p1  ORF type:complete len:434 (-),score=47.67 GHVL01031328.1:678-1979(-)
MVSNTLKCLVPQRFADAVQNQVGSQCHQQSNDQEVHQIQRFSFERALMDRMMSADSGAQIKPRRVNRKRSITQMKYEHSIKSLSTNNKKKCVMHDKQHCQEYHLSDNGKSVLPNQNAGTSQQIQQQMLNNSKHIQCHKQSLLRNQGRPKHLPIINLQNQRLNAIIGKLLHKSYKQHHKASPHSQQLDCRSHITQLKSVPTMQQILPSQLSHHDPQQLMPIQDTPSKYSRIDSIKNQNFMQQTKYNNVSLPVTSLVPADHISQDICPLTSVRTPGCSSTIKLEESTVQISRSQAKTHSTLAQTTSINSNRYQQANRHSLVSPFPSHFTPSNDVIKDAMFETASLCSSDELLECQNSLGMGTFVDITDDFPLKGQLGNELAELKPTEPIMVAHTSPKHLYSDASSSVLLNSVKQNSPFPWRLQEDECDLELERLS